MKRRRRRRQRENKERNQQTNDFGRKKKIKSYLHALSEKWRVTTTDTYRLRGGFG